jgi:N6-adenosine-specific RNA methylase IME4/DNA-binding CsgD family transcriptional regulator
LSDHPQLFDALPAPVEDALRASIQRFGVLVPVVRDQHGGMIDGRHRARIADELGVKYRVDTVRVADADEAAEIQRTLNADRRHLDESQRRAVVVELRREGHSERAIAGALGVSKTTVHNDIEDARLVTGDQSVEPKRVVRQGGGSYPARRPVVVSSRDETEAAKTQQALQVIPADAPSALTANEAQRLAARSRTPEPVKAPVPIPTGQYRTVVLDPPWPMKKIERQERPNQGVELDYPTMPVGCLEPCTGDEYLDGLPCFRVLCDCDDSDCTGPHEPCKSIECVVGEVVREAAYDDCHMYLWVTHKYLPAGLELLEAWGFRYQCVMTWRKNVGITPFSWMYDTEHVLFGTRGNQPLQRLGMRLSFEAPVVGHSVKPDVFYERVTEASPGPRLEMFARRDREGFEAWGNEVAADVV